MRDSEIYLRRDFSRIEKIFKNIIEKDSLCYFPIQIFPNKEWKDAPNHFQVGIPIKYHPLSNNDHLDGYLKKYKEEIFIHPINGKISFRDRFLEPVQLTSGFFISEEIAKMSGLPYEKYIPEDKMYLAMLDWNFIRRIDQLFLDADKQ
jgi:hypothetical protein